MTDDVYYTETLDLREIGRENDLGTISTNFGISSYCSQATKNLETTMNQTKAQTMQQRFPI